MKGSSKGSKIQEFMYKDTTNVEHESYYYTRGNWRHRILTRGLRKILEAIPGKHSIGSPQKTAVLETSHIIWKVLQFET
jgi:hypothetical protein